MNITNYGGVYITDFEESDYVTYDLDILNSQKINNKLTISLCRNKVCQLPLKKISELFKTIKYPILG